MEKEVNYEDLQRGCFDKEQMHQIGLGLVHKVDVSIYAKPEFDCEQMNQIRLGLEEGLDVSLYAKFKYNAVQMKEERDKLRNMLWETL